MRYGRNAVRLMMTGASLIQRLMAMVYSMMTVVVMVVGVIYVNVSLNQSYDRILYHKFDR